MDNSNKILDLINHNEIINRYKHLEQLVNNDHFVTNQMTKLKTIQKEIVHAKEFNKKSLLSKLEKDYQDKYNEITNHPLMAEYIDLQYKINILLQDFIEIVENAINSDLSAK